ncbi:hypothetical protein N7510_001935 [Penicillium lagena]|uniref:uncharacterized protein n=1 Tax=Penicillium lagena TaxID=94218 RepID=UPI0025422FF3|nr:uncharacterized protein N7510_001935 [Penicillium lagena]KAJ5625626.1 hypothetical protein N7510_001935 [Penicillium lagena]
MAPSIRGPVPWRICQCLVRQHLRSSHLAKPRHLSTSSYLNNHASPSNPLRSQARRAAESQSQHRRSIILSTAGIVACAVAMYGVIKLDVFGLDAIEAEKKGENQPNPGEVVTTNNNKAMKMDGPSGFPESAGPSVIPIQGKDGLEQVATGNSTVPYFPSTIRLPAMSSGHQPGDELPSAGGDEYQLLGLGIRTVSFLSIQVYVVGLYVAKSDITELQQRLVRTAMHPPSVSDISAVTSVGADSATSLVPPERQQLKDLLLDPERGDAAWTALLQDPGIRTAFRIVPTRNTDFMHLRDGWVRGITGRAQKKPEFSDEEFGSAMNDFKAVFGGSQRKNVPKCQTLVLLRGANGALDALFQPDPAQPSRWLGRVADERISRLVWLNYLSGKTVSSDGARKSIVDGLMTIVERPVGTVVQRVV